VMVFVCGLMSEIVPLTVTSRIAAFTGKQMQHRSSAAIIVKIHTFFMIIFVSQMGLCFISAREYKRILLKKTALWNRA